MTDDINSTLGRKLLALCGILLMGAAFFGFYYYLASSNPASARQWAAAMGSKNPFAGKPRAMVPPAKSPDIILKPMEETLVGNIKLVYHGLAAGNQVQISLAILALDPSSFYIYTIPLSAARKGFQMGGQHFRVVKARNSRLHLRWEK